MVVNICVSIESEKSAEAEASPNQTADSPPRKGWRPILGGVALFTGALILLVSNEQRALDRESALAAHLESAATAPSDELDPTLEGKLVHLEGLLLAPAPLRDRPIPVEVRALRLDRRVQMYQWEAQQATREEPLPSGEVRRVEVESYAKIWSENPIDSSKFADPIHANPAFPFTSKRTDVSSPRLGALRVSGAILEGLNDFQVLQADPRVAEQATLGTNVIARGDHYYVGGDPDSPQIGDLRVIYRYVPEGITASGIGQQIGDTLGAFSFRDETLPAVVLPGSHGPHELLAASPDPIARWVSLIRAIALLLVMGGLAVVFSALRNFGPRVDWIGDLLYGGAAVNGALVGLGVGMSVIGIVWLVAEHYAGVAFVVLGLAVIFLDARYRVAEGAKLRSEGRASTQSGSGTTSGDEKGGIDTQ